MTTELATRQKVVLFKCLQMVKTAEAAPTMAKKEKKRVITRAKRKNLTSHE